MYKTYGQCHSRESHYKLEAGEENPIIGMAGNLLLFPDTKVILVTPSKSSLGDFFQPIGEFIDSVNKNLTKRSVTAPYHELGLYNRSRLRGFYCRSAFCGMCGQDADYILVDDAAKIDDKIFRASLYPVMMTDLNTKLFCVFH